MAEQRRLRLVSADVDRRRDLLPVRGDPVIDRAGGRRRTRGDRAAPRAPRRKPVQDPGLRERRADRARPRPRSRRADRAGASLGGMKGIGPALVEKITTLVTTGSLPYLDGLRGQLPGGDAGVAEDSGVGSEEGARDPRHARASRRLRSSSRPPRTGSSAIFRGSARPPRRRSWPGSRASREHAGRFLRPVILERGSAPDRAPESDSGCRADRGRRLRAPRRLDVQGHRRRRDGRGRRRRHGGVRFGLRGRRGRRSAVRRSAACGSRPGRTPISAWSPRRPTRSRCCTSPAARPTTSRFAGARNPWD